MEKNLFSIRLKCCFLTSTTKKINLGTGNPAYQPIRSAVLDPPINHGYAQRKCTMLLSVMLSTTADKNGTIHIG